MSKGWVLPVLLAASIGSLSEAADWNQYHGPKRDLISSETGWNPNLPDSIEPLWTHSIGVGFASVSVVGDKAYTAGNTGGQDHIYCFDINTGDEIWKHSYDCEVAANMHEGGPCGTPTIDDGLLYSVSKEGHLWCLDAENGGVVWMKDIKSILDAKMPTWRFSVSPLVIGDMLIIDAGVSAALNKKSGEIIWKTSNDYGASYSSPIEVQINGTQCIAVFPKYGAVILEAKSGKELAKYPWENRVGVNAVSLVVSDNQIFMSSGYNKGAAMIEIDENWSVNELWQNRLMRNKMNTSVLLNGYLYGFDESSLKCIEFETGKEQWKEGGLGMGSLMCADGKLIILSERGELAIAQPDPSGYKEVSRTRILNGKCWSVPVLAQGKIFARDAAGDLVCVDVSS